MIPGNLKAIVVLILLLSLTLSVSVAAQDTNIPIPEKAAISSWGEATPLSQIIEETGKKCFCSELVFCSDECHDKIRSGQSHDNDCECATMKVAKSKTKKEFEILGSPCDCGGYIVTTLFYTSPWRYVTSYDCTDTSHKVDCGIKQYVRDKHYEYSCGTCGYYSTNISKAYKEEHF